jgi:hypothetical protein
MLGSLPDSRLRSAVEDELNRILQSPHFRTSRRSQQFLRYVVEHTLDGLEDHLKERAIGAALFDRAPDYDTGEDAAVRVAANEVRKRLAQYHLETPSKGIRIEMPAGGYHAAFHGAEAQAQPAHSAIATGWRRRAVPAVLIVLALLAAVLMLRPQARPASAFNEFWAPLVEGRNPVVISLANPLVYLLADPPATPAPALEPVAPGSPEDLARRGVVESQDQYVGIGDAYAASQFAALFARLGKPSQVRIGNEVSFLDLRNSPAVLIGAYSNRWSMQMTTEFRFGFERYSIVDRQKPGQVWRIENMRPGYRSDEDYVLVSRILDGYSGEPIVLAAGITHAGTYAAGELLTRPDYLEEALRGAPPDWRRRNLQLVLHCKVVGVTPRPPRLVASHYW